MAVPPQSAAKGTVEVKINEGADSLKALDHKRPIREADFAEDGCHVRFVSHKRTSGNFPEADACGGRESGFAKGT
jgi:hypothetical protein